MSIAVTINEVDRTSRVELNSLRIDNVLTRKRDKCRFNVLVNPNDSYSPIIGQEVIVTLDADRVFGGVIVALEQEATSYKLVRWKVECDDFTRLLDRRLVPDIYQNQTVDEILLDLMRYFPAGFTISGVSAPVNIAYVSFNYKPLSKAIEDLADMTGYDWYVDYNKNIQFFQVNTNPAAIDIEDGNGTMIYDTLVIRKDNSQVRNSIIVRGGEYVAASFTSQLEGNGVDFVFPLPYRFADFRATLTGEALNVGIDNIDDPDSFDALYNFQEKFIRFKAEDVPPSGAVLVYSGHPYLPVIVRQQSNSSIATFSAMEGGDGVYEYLIVDKSINTKEGARQRARAELETYATTLSEGEFRTHTSGFRAGQKLRINSVSRGVNDLFIINRVTLQQFDEGSFLYEVSLVTTKSFDLVDMLIQLQLNKNKEVTIDPNEVTDIIFSLDDEMQFSDSLGTFTSSGGPYVYDHTGNRWNFRTWG